MTRFPIPSVVLAAMLSYALPAGAGDASGEYEVGPQSVKVSITSWGDDCGPKPKSYGSKGKGTVTVVEEGDHLVFSNGKSTKKCWSANVKLQRVSVTKKGNSWTIVCESPATDSNHEKGTYMVTLGAGSIKVKDISDYDWKLKDSVCQATITIDHVFTKVGTAPAEEPVEDKPPEPAPETKQPPLPDPPVIEKDYPDLPPESECKFPGAMSKLVISPSNATTAPGHSVCFSVFGLDPKGCKVSASPEWRLSKDDPGREGRLDGSCFIPGLTAAQSEGTFKVVVTEGTLTDTAKITVRTMSIEDLIAVNLDPTATGAENTAESAPDPVKAIESATKVQVPVSTGKKPLPVWLIYLIPPVLLVLVLAAIIAWVVVDRRRRIRRRIEEVEAEREAKARLSRSGLGAPASMAPRPSDDPLAQTRQRKQARLPSAGGSGQHANPRLGAPPGGNQQSGHPGIQPGQQPSGVPARPPAGVPQARAPVAGPGQPQAPSRGQAPAPGQPQTPGQPQPAPAKMPALVCRVCGKEYEAGSKFCPMDGSGLVRAGEHPGQAHETGMVCPRCGRGYPPGSRNCGEDGEVLVPVAAADAALGRVKDEHFAGRKKICPKCSTIYGDESTFCGADGQRLVPMN